MGASLAPTGPWWRVARPQSLPAGAPLGVAPDGAGPWGAGLSGACYGCPLRPRPSPPPPAPPPPPPPPPPPAAASAPLASSPARRASIPPGCGSGSSMVLPSPCVLAAWCLLLWPSGGGWSCRSSAERSRSGSSERQLRPSFQWATLPQVPSMVRALPRVGARLARWCRWALVRRTGRWRALGRRRGTLRGPALLAPWFPPSF